MLSQIPPQKKRIQNRFDAASLSYETVHSVQQACAVFLGDLLRTEHPAFFPQTVLDVGAGTGNVSARLQEFFPEASYTLNDLSENMLMRARERFRGCSTVSFLSGDIETLLSQDTLPYPDLIISNLCLQWTQHLENTICALYRKTQKSLAFSCLLSGTFRRWKNRLATHDLHGLIRTYPEAAAFSAFIKTLTPVSIIRVKRFTLPFPSPLQVMRYLKQLGASTPQRADTKTSALLRLAKTDRMPCILEYEVAFVVLGRG